MGVLGRTPVVDLAVAITYGDCAADGARDIQQHVIATLRDRIGLQTVVVNVTVDDILTGEGDQRANRGRRHDRRRFSGPAAACRHDGDAESPRPPTG